MMQFFFALAILLASSTCLAQQDRTITITSSGVTRTFEVHLPSATPPAMLPLLICYHGTGGNGSGMRAVTGFDALADRYGFVVAYPSSTRIGGDLQWNVYIDNQPGHGGDGIDDASATDDVQFTRDLIARMASEFDVDTKRVYATGLSNGGFMSYALSMLAPDAIKAIAPVAANMWADDAYLTAIVSSGSVPPIPVMHVHGTADNVVGYPDPDNTPKEYEEYPLFVASRGCGALTYGSVVPIMNGVDKLLFCPAPVEVSLVRVQGMGHAWTNGVYPTSLEIVKFFGLDKTSGIDDISATPSIAIAPNPARDVLRIESPFHARVEIISSIGHRYYDADHPTGLVEVSVTGMPRGVYMVRIMPMNGEPMVRPIVVGD